MKINKLMINKLIMIVIILMTTGCSEFALLTSGTSVAVSQNVYAKAYSGIDILTIMQTKKDIKDTTNSIMIVILSKYKPNCI